MERSNQKTTIHRKLVTQEYLGKSPHMKSLMLIEEMDILITTAAYAVSLGRSSIYRAIRAKEEGRELGINGRPPIFNKEDNEELLKRLYAILNKVPLTKKILQDEVISAHIF